MDQFSHDYRPGFPMQYPFGWRSFLHLPLLFVEQSTQFLLTRLRRLTPETGEKELGGLLDERQREVRKTAASNPLGGWELRKPGL